MQASSSHLNSEIESVVQPDGAIDLHYKAYMFSAKSLMPRLIVTFFGMPFIWIGGAMMGLGNGFSACLAIGLVIANLYVTAVRTTSGTLHMRTNEWLSFDGNKLQLDRVDEIGVWVDVGGRKETARVFAKVNGRKVWLSKPMTEESAEYLMGLAQGASGREWG